MSPRRAFPDKAARASLVLGLIASLVHVASADTKPREYRLAAGPNGGLYSKVGSTLAKALAGEDAGFSLRVISSTSGSRDNLAALLAGEADLAIIQSNTAASSEYREAGLRGIASLYTECMHIAVAADSPARDIDDLRGLRIALGKEGSGSLEDARRMLNAAGIYRTEYHHVHLPVGGKLDLSPSGNSDAIILTGGIPNPELKALSSDLRLLGLPQDLMKKLLEENRDLVPATIPPFSYSGQADVVQTVGVRALLVCTGNLDPSVVGRIAEAIATDPAVAETIRTTKSSPDIMELADRGMPIPLHPGAADFFRFRILSASALRRWASSLAVAGCVLAFWAVVAYGQSGWSRFVRRNIYLKLIFGLLSIYLLATVSIYYFERDRTPGFESLARSFWSTMVYVLSGLESREPRTTGGRAGLAVLLFASIGMLGSVAGQFASIFINHRAKKMPNDLSNHILICHWNDRAEQIITEIHDDEAEPDTDIVVASAGEIRSELLSSENSRKLHHRICNVEITAGLEKVRAGDAKSVIVLADAAAPDPDSRTILTLLALTQLFQSRGTAPRPHVVAECLSHLRLAHMKAAGANEVVCSDRYGLGILAQCAIQKRLSEVYDRLLHYSKDSSEVYILPASELPDRCKEMSFDALSREFAASRSKENPVILLGTRKQDGHISLNPRGSDAAAPLTAGDSLVLVAFYRPVLANVLSGA